MLQGCLCRVVGLPSSDMLANKGALRIENHLKHSDESIITDLLLIWLAQI